MQALPADRGTKRKAHSIDDGIPEGVTEVRPGDGCGGKILERFGHVRRPVLLL